MKEFSQMLVSKVEKLESLLNYNIGDKNARLIYQSIRDQATNKGVRGKRKRVKGTGNELYGK